MAQAISSTIYGSRVYCNMNQLPRIAIERILQIFVEGIVRVVNG
jgi:hypothetical protein